MVKIKIEYAVCANCKHLKTCAFIKQFKKKYMSFNINQRHRCGEFEICKNI